MTEIWKHALDSIRAGEHTVLLVVTAHQGSVPGKTGAMAIVSPLGLAGTIGGGSVEKELTDEAARFDGRAKMLTYDHGSPETDSICSGSQYIGMLRLGPDEAPVLESICDTLDEEGGGTLTISPSGLGFERGIAQPREFHLAGEEWSFREPLGKLDTLYIVGGGHVSLAFSRIMATLPFRIVVLDDRRDVPTMAANRWASERHVIDYEEVAEHIADGESSWVTIMTHAHVADRRVLEKLLGKPLAYLGMMGSKPKVARLFAAMLKEGIDAALLDGVHSPIGVEIGSHTPEEIAISIAAEIIAVRNRRRPLG
jgi:xanthine dehydrogenase accessory factor